MVITPIHTEAITPSSLELTALLARYLPPLQENSIVAITSKVVSLCEGAVVRAHGINKHELIRQEAVYYLPPEGNRYGLTLTLRDQVLIPTAGIDESNGNGYYILWPRHPQETANQIRAFLRERYGLKNVGVLLTDSKSTPLRRGTTGLALAFSGFAALNAYVGKPDIFGHLLRVTQANIADGLAAAAVVTMGEGNEHTPLALIEDCPAVEFKETDPEPEELQELKISLEDDLYAPLLTKAEWLRGGRD